MKKRLLKSMLKLDQKGFIPHVALVLLLIAGIGLGVWLIGQKTNILPFASESGPVISPSPTPVSNPVSPSPSATPTPTPVACNPKKFDPSTWKIITVGECRGGKQNIRYRCENKQRIDKVSCPKPTKPGSGGGTSN